MRIKNPLIIIIVVDKAVTKKYGWDTFSQKWKGGTEENATLFPGRDGTTLNATCYNCRNPGCID